MTPEKWDFHFIEPYYSLKRTIIIVNCESKVVILFNKRVSFISCQSLESHDLISLHNHVLHWLKLETPGVSDRGGGVEVHHVGLNHEISCGMDNVITKTSKVILNCSYKFWSIPFQRTLTAHEHFSPDHLPHSLAQHRDLLSCWSTL